MIDLWTFVQGTPPMWLQFRDGNPGGWNAILVALRGVESLFLVSLPLSAALLLLRSRWAVVLTVAQLPVRILCGYSLILVAFWFWILGERSLPNLPWLLVLTIMELLRIAVTAVAVRGKGATGPLRPGLPSAGRGSAAWGTVVAVTLLLGWLHLHPAPSGEASSDATIESLLQDIDRHLFSGPGGAGSGRREAKAVAWQGGETPDGAEVDTLGWVNLGSAGIPDSLVWVPGCGPWNLEHLIRFELNLFAGPWAERWKEGSWTEGSIDPLDDGWRLRIVRSGVSADPANLNAPIVRALQVKVDDVGVPRNAMCELDMKIIPARAYLSFEYEEIEGRVRVERIHHLIEMANVSIRPVVHLRYRSDGARLLEGIDFSVPAGDLSPTLGQLVGGEIYSRLRLVEHRIP